MLLDELNNKTVTQIELAIKLDNFDYEKNETMYFEKMACYGLLDSHVHYIKQYVDILEHKDSGKRALFDELLSWMNREFNHYSDRISVPSATSLDRKLFHSASHILEQLKKYDSQY